MDRFRSKEWMAVVIVQESSNWPVKRLEESCCCAGHVLVQFLLRNDTVVELMHKPSSVYELLSAIVVLVCLGTIAAWSLGRGKARRKQSNQERAVR